MMLLISVLTSCEGQRERRERGMHGESEAGGSQLGYHGHTSGEHVGGARSGQGRRGKACTEQLETSGCMVQEELRLL